MKIMNPLKEWTKKVPHNLGYLVDHPRISELNMLTISMQKLLQISTTLLIIIGFKIYLTIYQELT